MLLCCCTDGHVPITMQVAGCSFLGWDASRRTRCLMGMLFSTSLPLSLVRELVLPMQFGNIKQYLTQCFTTIHCLYDVSN